MENVLKIFLEEFPEAREELATAMFKECSVTVSGFTNRLNGRTKLKPHEAKLIARFRKKASSSVIS